LLYIVAALSKVRKEAAADDWLAAIFARIKFGTAMAAMIKMIATTISNSINEKLRFCWSWILSSSSPWPPEQLQGGSFPLPPWVFSDG